MITYLGNKVTLTELKSNGWCKVQYTEHRVMVTRETKITNLKDDSNGAEINEAIKKLIG